MLTFEVSMEAYEQDQNASGNEGRPKRLSHAPETVHGRMFRVDSANSRVQAKQLRDGNANAGERERCPQPGQEGSFYSNQISKTHSSRGSKTLT
jgi:hypothetical protein